MTYIKLQDIISILPLSVRTHGCLRRAGIHTVEQMISLSEQELTSIKNMGKVSVSEAQKWIRLLQENDCFLLDDGTIKSVKKGSAQNDENLIEQCFDSQSSTGDQADKLVRIDVVIDDVPLEELGLSVRSHNCLKTAGYKSSSQLADATIEDLLKLKNMGQKSAMEVISSINSLKRPVYEVSLEDQSFSEYMESICEEMTMAFGHTNQVWKGELLSTRAEHPDARGETFLYYLYERQFVITSLKKHILSVLQANSDEIKKIDLEDALPRHMYNTSILDEALLDLENCDAITLNDDLVLRTYPSILEYANNISDEKQRSLLLGRLNGKSLALLGEEHGVTRERIRQIVDKVLSKRPKVREDKYLDLFSRYDFSIDIFIEVFDEKPCTYHYLEIASSARKGEKEAIDKLIDDTDIPVSIRKKVKRTVYKDYIFVDGTPVSKRRPELVKCFVQKHCRNLTKFDDFISQYHDFLESLELEDDEDLRLEARTYENIISNSDYALWNQWRSFRYYNVKGQSYKELLQTLDLRRYRNVELSTLKFVKDYPEVMELYDIRDEYELHNLLKKILPANSRVTFKRMPTIEIGTADRDEQILSLLLQYAPISAEEFAKKYEEEYGVKKATVLGTYLKQLDDYFHNGQYSIEADNLPYKEYSRMKELLVDDFYTIPDIEAIYHLEFPDENLANINPYTLKTLGFRVYSGYVIQNTYLSAAEYFRKLLTTDDVVDARNISKAIQNVVAYSSELYKLRADYEIVEFAPLQYINIRRLNAVGVTTDIFENYCKAVARNYDKGEYFTVTSLRREGFVHELDELGFDEWFYSSVLLEDRDQFSYQRTGGTRLFLRGKSGANLGDMLVWLLGKHKKIDLYDLKDLLEDLYGIVLPKEKLLTIIGGTELYYDAIMEAVYIDYDTYFEEI